MKTWGLFGALAVAAALATSPVMAADMPAKEPVYAKAPIAADVWSPWMIRVRALGVLPNTGGGRFDQAAMATYNLTYSNAVVPELDITYFFTKNIAAELILGVTKHNIGVGGVGALVGTPVGSTWLLPPTVTLQYHFTDFGAFKPYVGVGVNYTIPFSVAAAGGTITQLSLGNGWGVAAQAGFDYMFTRNWGFNVDVKKLWVDTSFSANAGALTGRTHLDPWLVGVGLTYRFGGPVMAKY
jgi:outer membrane protein